MILVRKLVGRQVISSDARNVGEVGGAYVELSSLKISHLAVDLDDDAIDMIGFKKPRTSLFGMVSVCLPIEIIQAVGDVITLNKTLEELSTLSINKCKT